MEFDMQTLGPTYRLTVGLPGRSNALAIATRLGLPEKIIEDARSELDPNDLRAEDLLNEIHLQRDLARKARQQADAAKQTSEKLKADLTARLEKIEDERRDILEKSRQQAEAQAAELQDEIETLRKQLARARQPLEALKPLQEQAAGLGASVQKPVERSLVDEAPRPLRLGDKVRVRSIKMEGVITAMTDSDFEVQVGNLRVRARQGDLQRAGEPEQPVVVEQSKTTMTRAQSPSSRKISTAEAAGFYPSPGMELDLRGQRAEDAMDALDRYLESAYLAGLLFVRIIHGKGTGRLRQVIRESLTHSPHVRRWESGDDKEGGEGVTVAHLSQ
jgi:DNA mismatch repair protein MutS2